MTEQKHRAAAYIVSENPETMVVDHAAERRHLQAEIDRLTDENLTLRAAIASRNAYLAVGAMNRLDDARADRLWRNG